MLIADILRRKGSDVLTCTADQTTTEVLATLAEYNVGALVVVVDGAPVGILSERDIVRSLYAVGATALTATVADLMTNLIISCQPGDSVDIVSSQMTENRIRHVPVLADGRLVGIVTIGDVVAARISELETTRERLEDYITRG
jgi:CBS domain-containing protein